MKDLIKYYFLFLLYFYLRIFYARFNLKINWQFFDLLKIIFKTFLITGFKIKLIYPLFVWVITNIR